MTRHHDVDRAIVAASECSGIPVPDILGLSRSLSVARARSAAMVVARRRTDASASEIVFTLGRASHKLVALAIKRFERDAVLAALVARIEARFYGSAA